MYQVWAFVHTEQVKEWRMFSMFKISEEEKAQNLARKLKNDIDVVNVVITLCPIIDY